MQLSPGPGGLSVTLCPLGTLPVAALSSSIARTSLQNGSWVLKQRTKSCRISEGLSPELTQCTFYYSLLVDASHKTNPDLRGRAMTLFLDRKNRMH